LKCSILIPLYQAQDYYRETLEIALNQTHRDCQVVVVIDDDFDYDLPPQVTRVRAGHGSGPNAARNAGLAWCQGDMILPLDADDWMSLDRVEKLLPLVQRYGVAGDCEMTRNKRTGQVERQVFEPSDQVRLLSPQDYLALNATIHLAFRRDVITRWPESVALAGDTLFNLDAIERAGQLAIHPQTLFEYRTHPDSHCHRAGSIDRAERGYQEILRLIQCGVVARDPELNAFARNLFTEKRATNQAYGDYVQRNGPHSFDHFLETQR